MEFDTRIHHVVVADGVHETRATEVWLKDGRIARVGELENAAAREEIDGNGYFLIPGFVDIHRHADLAPFQTDRSIEILQGITSMISGNCGFAAVPNAPDSFLALCDYAEPIIGRIPAALAGKDFAGLFSLISQRPLALNSGYLAGNGALRICVKGFDPAPMSEPELEMVCALLEKAFCDGALGLSLGLLYTPECFYSAAELVRIAAVAARHRRPVIAHIRGEGNSLLASVREMLEIGRRSGAQIHISHLKAAGKRNWRHAIDAALELIDKANANGQRVSFDVYPYDAGSTTLLTLFPPETLAGGLDGFLAQVNDPARREYLIGEMRREQEEWDNLVYSTGWDHVMVSGSSDPDEVGKHLQALADVSGVSPEAFAIGLLQREHGNVPIVFQHMAQEDVDKILLRSDSMVISDALYSASGLPHPRKFGTHARVLCRYVKEKKWLSLEQAVAKMSALPAKFLQLEGRGQIAEGYWADLLLLDWDALQDRADYLHPRQPPAGIRALWINGRPVCENGAILQSDAGKLLRRVSQS